MASMETCSRNDIYGYRFFSGKVKGKVFISAFRKQGNNQGAAIACVSGIQ